MSDHLSAGKESTVVGLLVQLGVLRILLLGTTLVLAAFAIGVPEPYGSVWNIIHGGVAPAVVPLLFMVVIFDALMARVWLSEASGQEAARLRRIIAIDLGVVLVLVIAWAPFFSSVLLP